VTDDIVTPIHIGVIAEMISLSSVSHPAPKQAQYYPNTTFLWQELQESLANAR